MYSEKDLQLLLEKPVDQLPQSKARTLLDESNSSLMSTVELPKMSSLSQEITHLGSPPSASDDEEDDQEDFAHLDLAEHLRKLSINAFEDRFFGRSRYVYLLFGALLYLALS